MFNRSNLFLAPVASLMLSACGSLPQSTGIMQMGPDSFKIVHRSAFGRPIKSQADAMEMVRSFCDQKQLQVQVISSRMLGLMTSESDLDGAFEASFKCVK